MRFEEKVDAVQQLDLVRRLLTEEDPRRARVEAKLASLVSEVRKEAPRESGEEERKRERVDELLSELSAMGIEV